MDCYCILRELEETTVCWGEKCSHVPGAKEDFASYTVVCIPNMLYIL